MLLELSACAKAMQTKFIICEGCIGASVEGAHDFGGVHPDAHDA